MIRNLFIILIFIHFYKNSEACTTQSVVNCSTITASTRVILVWGIIPTGNCTLVQIGATSFIFDPIMVNYVWITLNNSANSCIADIAARAITLTQALKYGPSQEIIILNVTAQYYRMVVVNTSCINCTVFPSTSDLEGRLRNSNLQLYPIYNNLNTNGKYCLYNGTMNLNYTGAGYNCICPVNSTFVGPNCEIMEAMVSNTIPYFNIFRSATTINLRFSIFSKGITGVVSLLTIKNSTYQRMVEMIVDQSVVILKIQDSFQTNTSIVMDNQIWHDIGIVVTQLNATLMIDSLTLQLPFVGNPGDFRSFYLLIDEKNTAEFAICIKNLIINSKVIDLYSPNYTSCCNTRCSCSQTQQCYCSPFVSSGNSYCYCNLGYVSINGNCVPSNTPLYQIASNTTAIYPLGNYILGRIDFGFQTLSINGSLLTLNLSNPVTNISIQIVNTNLTMTVTNQTPRRINYNVSDGQMHNVSLMLKNYSLELNLDYNENYTNYYPNWFLINGLISASSFMLGTMQLPFNSTINNLTTCFSTVRLNLASVIRDIFPSDNSNLSVQCSNGPRCSSGNITCSANQFCKDNEWQNTKCICIANFSSVNGTCTYNQCIVNPCLNGGQCSYLASSNNFSCSCLFGFSGGLCANVLSTLWWIAVLVVLLILLIILIIVILYCCFIRNRSTENVYITKINENIVTYNDQAGECDYNGPPIDFNLMKSALRNKAPILPLPALINTKEALDKNNNDLILDHPLEYGYEGYNSDNGSISSIGSKSATSELPPDNYLSNVYDKA